MYKRSRHQEHLASRSVECKAILAPAHKPSNVAVNVVDGYGINQRKRGQVERLQRDRGGIEERLCQEVGAVGGGIGHHQREIEERRCNKASRDGSRCRIDDLAIVRIHQVF